MKHIREMKIHSEHFILETEWYIKICLKVKEHFLAKIRNISKVQFEYLKCTFANWRSYCTNELSKWIEKNLHFSRRRRTLVIFHCLIEIRYLIIVAIEFVDSYNLQSIHILRVEITTLFSFIFCSICRYNIKLKRKHLTIFCTLLLLSRFYWNWI